MEHTQTAAEWELIRRAVKVLGWKDGLEIGANYPSYWYPPTGDPVHKSFNPCRDLNDAQRLAREWIGDNEDRRAYVEKHISPLDPPTKYVAIVANDKSGE